MTNYILCLLLAALIIHYTGELPLEEEQLMTGTEYSLKLRESRNIKIKHVFFLTNYLKRCGHTF